VTGSWPERLAAVPEPPVPDRRSGWRDPPGLPWCGTGVFIGVLMASRPDLEERLEFSHGLITALGEPRTLRLGLLASAPDLNPPQPSDPGATRPP
jgi:hypothetical protein